MPPITIEQFRQTELRAGKVLEAASHPNADRLLVVKVDLGEPQPRQLVAGIKKSYAPEQLVGKTVIVAANIPPAVLRGVESQGMILAAPSGDAISILTTEKEVPPGTLIT